MRAVTQLQLEAGGHARKQPHRLWGAACMCGERGSASNQRSAPPSLHPPPPLSPFPTCLPACLQSFVVEYIVERHMCPTCNRQNANPNAWVACVQVRQHVQHKRTFFFLEQLILKHGADEACVNVKEMHEVGGWE